MVDADRVASRLERLDQLIATLEIAHRDGRQAIEGDERSRLAVLHALQLSIQICLDVGAHLVAEGGLGGLDDYADVFRSLERGGVLGSELSARLVDAAGMRNVIVHEYLTVDFDRIWRALERLDDLRDYARAATCAVESQR